MRLDAQKVFLLMANLGLDQKGLAEKAGISRQTLSALMNGRNCRPKSLKKISDALQAKPEEIVTIEN